MLNVRRKRGMLDVKRKRDARCECMKEHARHAESKDMQVFLVTFRRWNFKTLIKVIMLIIRRFNLMYAGLKYEHQQVLIKSKNPKIL